MALGAGQTNGTQWSNEVANSGQTRWRRRVVLGGAVITPGGAVVKLDGAQWSNRAPSPPAYRAYKYTPRVVAACVATVRVVKLGSGGGGGGAPLRAR